MLTTSDSTLIILVSRPKRERPSCWSRLSLMTLVPHASRVVKTSMREEWLT